MGFNHEDDLDSPTEDTPSMRGTLNGLKRALKFLPFSVGYYASDREFVIRAACELVNAAYSNRTHRRIVESTLTKDVANGILSLSTNQTKE